MPLLAFAAFLIAEIRARRLAAPRPPRRASAFVASALGMLLLSACSSAGGPSCDGVSTAAAPGSYGLGPGDRVRVVVFRNEELSGEFALDGDGYVALPLVGEMAAGGLTTRQLEDEIEIRLKADGMLVDPQVGVQLVTYRSFYVLGEVGTPGSYEYRSGMTVINAIALAGGYTYRADQSNVMIGRGNCRLATQADTLVEPGDIITIDERFF